MYFISKIKKNYHEWIKKYNEWRQETAKKTI